jgi:hypothetical protein
VTSVPADRQTLDRARAAGVPVILTSRADALHARVASCVVAVFHADAHRHVAVLRDA